MFTILNRTLIDLTSLWYSHVKYFYLFRCTTNAYNERAFQVPCIKGSVAQHVYCSIFKV